MPQQRPPEGTAATEPKQAEKSLGQLVGEMSSELSSIMRAEVQLAKVELKDEVSKAGKAGGMFGAGAVTGYFALLFASLALAWLLDQVMPVALAFFLVAATLLRAYVADILITALPYGALAAPIGALLFCFFFGMAVLLGAELNATIQARWPAPLRRHERRRRERRAAKLEEARRLGLL